MMNQSNYQNKFNSHKDEEIIRLYSKSKIAGLMLIQIFCRHKPETLVDALLNIDLEYRNKKIYQNYMLEQYQSSVESKTLLKRINLVSSLC